MSRNTARRGEWRLMYAQGLEPADIARICHTLPHHAEAYLREQVQRDPNLFDRRLCRCLEPALPVFRHKDATRGWDGNRLSLARFIQSRGRFPRRSADTSTTAGALEVFLYHWVRAQRAASAGGRLTGRQERRLEAIPRWTVLGRDQINTRHWDERLRACAEFVEAHGHLPRYRNGKTTLERALGTWLSRQQSKRRRGTLSEARADALATLWPLPRHV